MLSIECFVLCFEWWLGGNQEKKPPGGECDDFWGPLIKKKVLVRAPSKSGSQVPNAECKPPV